MNKTDNRIYRQKETGGSAFPHKKYDVPEDGIYNPAELGMTLRDWFAGQALAGTLAHPGDSCDWEMFANAAYKIADAMIAERDK